MNNDFEKYLENFTCVKPSEEFRQNTLAASRQAWKTRTAQSSIFSFLFSPRSLLWAQAAMIAATLVFIFIENSMTEKFLADVRPKTENGTEKNMMEICKELGMDETYCRVIASARKLRIIDTKPINFAAYQKTINTIMKEGVIQ